jgi:ABC-type transporter Mla subunit MlaD
VQGGRVVVGALGDHEAALRAMVRDGERTLSALARRQSSLRATAAELPRLLSVARATLAQARPLVREARPAVADLRAAAPPLAGALHAVPGTASDLRAVLDRAPALRAAAVPVLARLRPVLAAATPAATRLGPAMRNVVTMARYLEPRKNTIAAWFANTADLGLNGDAKGEWARFFIFADPATAIGGRTTLGENAYTRPDDAAANAPYRPGDYPRLRPAPVPYRSGP